MINLRRINAVIFLYFLYLITLTNVFYSFQNDIYLFGLHLNKLATIVAFLIVLPGFPWKVFIANTANKVFIFIFIFIFLNIIIKAIFARDFSINRSFIYELLHFLWYITLFCVLRNKHHAKFVFRLFSHLLLITASVTVLRYLGLLSIENAAEFATARYRLTGRHGFDDFYRFTVANWYNVTLVFFWIIIRIANKEKYSYTKYHYFLILLFTSAMLASISRKAIFLTLTGGILSYVISTFNYKFFTQKTFFNFVSLLFLIAFIYYAQLYLFKNHFEIIQLRLFSSITDVTNIEGHYASRMGYIEQQLLLVGSSFFTFMFGVIFTEKYFDVQHLILANNGFTEELLYYGILLVLLFLIWYLHGLKTCLRYRNVTDPLSRDFANILFIFFSLNLILFPIMFSLFHTSLNISGTVFAMALAASLKNYSITTLKKMTNE